MNEASEALPCRCRTRRRSTPCNRWRQCDAASSARRRDASAIAIMSSSMRDSSVRRGGSVTEHRLRAQRIALNEGVFALSAQHCPLLTLVLIRRCALRVPVFNLRFVAGRSKFHSTPANLCRRARILRTPSQHRGASRPLLCDACAQAAMHGQSEGWATSNFRHCRFVEHRTCAASPRASCGAASAERRRVRDRAAGAIQRLLNQVALDREQQVAQDRDLREAAERAD